MEQAVRIPTVWRMRVHTTGEEADPNKTYPFLRERGLLGIGWKLGEIPKDADDAIRLAREKYVIEPENKKKKPHAVSIVRRFAKDMQIGDLVWVRHKNLFALYQITGDWEYKQGEEWDTHDVHFVREAKIIYETTEPPIGPIFSSLLGRLQTISKFQKHKELVTVYSLWLCNKYSKGSCPPVSAINLKSTRLIDLFSPEELEDVVGIYLQVKNGFVFVPSSRTRADNTAGYEYILKDKSGNPIFVQVKTSEIDGPEYNEKNWVLFSRDNYSSLAERYPKATVLSPDTIEQFVQQNIKIMPTKIKLLAQLFDELKSGQ